MTMEAPQQRHLVVGPMPPIDPQLKDQDIEHQRPPIGPQPEAERGSRGGDRQDEQWRDQRVDREQADIAPESRPVLRPVEAAAALVEGRRGHRMQAFADEKQDEPRRHDNGLELDDEVGDGIHGQHMAPGPGLANAAPRT
jgi:hypothetical protein